MGGQSGEIRSKSKIEAYLKYERFVEGVGEIFESRNPPKNKKLCKKLMVWDPDTGEWVLYYYLHT